MLRLRRTFIALLLATALGVPGGRSSRYGGELARNFTINQYCELTGGTAAVHYVVVFGQLPALSELHSADANGDGVTSQAERDAYVGKLAPALAEGLELVVNGSKAPLHATHSAAEHDSGTTCADSPTKAALGQVDGKGFGDWNLDAHYAFAAGVADVHEHPLEPIMARFTITKRFGS
jgi:hypothetical protein